MWLSKQNCFDARLERKQVHLRKAFIVAIIFLSLGGAVLAYSSGARNSLLRSRDQVLDQQAQIQRAYNDVDRKIAELQNQKYSLSRYLQDCDRQVRDLDRALNAQDSAYRDIR